MTSISYLVTVCESDTSFMGLCRDSKFKGLKLEQWWIPTVMKFDTEACSHPHAAMNAASQ